MRTKTTKAGCRARDFSDCGDPFIPEGELLSDAPDPMSVARELDEMNRRFDGLHIDAGFGPTAIPSAEFAHQHDARFELETEYRNQFIGGPTNGDPLQHGHRMAITRENFTRYAPASEREPIEAAQREDQDWGNAMMAEYEARWPDKAADRDGLSAAIDATMNDLKWHGENPGRWARANPDQFLRDVETNHSIGRGRRESDGRTAGITSGGGVTPRAQSPDADMSDTDWHREHQRKSGWW